MKTLEFRDLLQTTLSQVSMAEHLSSIITENNFHNNILITMGNVYNVSHIRAICKHRDIAARDLIT